MTAGDGREWVLSGVGKKGDIKPIERGEAGCWGMYSDKRGRVLAGKLAKAQSFNWRIYKTSARLVCAHNSNGWLWGMEPGYDDP